MLKDNLKKLRESKGLTKKQTALELGISERAYITYEYGEREPKLETLQKLADFYGVTTDYLLGRPGAKPPESPIDEFAKAERLKELEKIIIKEYLELGNEEREAVLDFIRNCIKKEEERKSSQETYIIQRAARGNPNPNAPVVETVEMTAEEIQQDREKPLEDWDL